MTGLQSREAAVEKRRETGSGAFWGFVRLLERQQARPPIILLENVPGWLVANQGRDFHAALTALVELDYACDAVTLDARWFTPQSRPRIFLVGVTRRR